jgi:hypothetical protein
MSSDDKKTSREDKGEGEGAPAPASGAAKDEEREGGLLPAILVGLGLLVVVGLLVFGGGGDDKADKAGGAKSAAAGKTGDEGGAGATPAGQGGVPARPYDKASAAPVGSAKINPAVKLPAVGMAPQGGEAPRKDDKPPEGASDEELIAWHEKKLEEAKKNLEQRKTFKERLPGIRQKIEESNHPQKEKELEAFEARAKTVSDNLDKAQAKVDELEKKLADLRGG